MVGTCDKSAKGAEDDYNKMKGNNLELAKALTEEKLLVKQCFDERNLLQKQLNESLLLNKRYESFFDELLAATKTLLPSCVAMSNAVTQIVALCTNAKTLLEMKENSQFETSTDYASGRSSSPALMNKTHAVKPMIGGHVIFRPFINLERLNDIDRNAIFSSANTDTEVSGRESSTSESILQTGDLNNSRVNNTENYPMVLNSHPLQDSPTTDDVRQMNGYGRELQMDRLSTSLHLAELNGIPEENEESITPPRDSSNFHLKEARIVIDPLPINVMQLRTETNRTGSNVTINIPISSTPNLNYDPLEGPSNLLDNRGRFTKSFYRNQSLNHSEISCQPDSSSEEEWTPPPNVNVRKRKRPSPESKQETKQPFVVLTNLKTSPQSADKFECERHLRRTKAPKTLKEPSLKCFNKNEDAIEVHLKWDTL